MLFIALSLSPKSRATVSTNKSTLSYTATANNWKKLHPNFCDIFMIIDESRRLR